MKMSGEELWGGNGIDERNEAGEELLQFCALNQLIVMNTWFQKKTVHYGTWMHPATKLSHMIDLVLMRMNQRFYCTDRRAGNERCHLLDGPQVGQSQIEDRSTKVTSKREASVAFLSP